MNIMVIILCVIAVGAAVAGFIMEHSDGSNDDKTK